MVKRRQFLYNSAALIMPALYIVLYGYTFISGHLLCIYCNVPCMYCGGFLPPLCPKIVQYYTMTPLIL